MPHHHPHIVTHLWFEKNVAEAARFYCSVFPDSEVTRITTLKDTPGGDCDVVLFRLSGQPFMALGNGNAPAFNESVSFVIQCENQEEIDYYYGKLSADPTAEQCGWIKDKYGLSWQIASASMRGFFESGNDVQIRKFAEAIWEMKHIDLNTLNAAVEDTANRK